MAGISKHDQSTSPTGDATKELELDHVLEMLPVGFFHYRLLIMCGLCFMADGLEVNLLAYISQCAGDEWGLSNAEVSSIAGVVFLGITLGSFVFGVLADRIGRRKCFLLSCLLISFFGFISGASPNVATLIIFRAIAGFGIGGANIPFDLLAEFMPISQRGQFGVYIELFWTFGSMIVAGLAWGTLDRDGWHNLAYYTAIPVAITCIASYFYLPESPRWLLIKGHHEQAKKIIEEAASLNGYKLPQFNLKAIEEIHENEKPTYRDLFGTPYLKRVTTILVSVFSLYGFTYYGMVLFVGRLYTKDDNGNVCSFDYADIFINTSAEIIGIFLSAFLLMKAGRVTTMVATYFIAGLGVLILAIPMGSGGVIFFAMVSRACIMAATGVTWVITAELFPTDLRTIAHCFCLAISRIAAFISPFMIYSSLNLTTIGCTLGVVNLIACAFSYFLPETGGNLHSFQFPAAYSSSYHLLYLMSYI